MPTWIEEFFHSEAVRSQEKGEWQSTLDAEVFRKSGTDAELGFEYGLNDRLQLNAELPYGFRSNVESEAPLSWSTVSVGAKYQLLRSSRPFAMTAGFGADLPATARGEFSWDPEILVAKQLRDIQLHGNLIADIAKDSREYEYNVASVCDLHSAWFPTLELNERRKSKGKNIFLLTPGIYRHFHRHIEAGVAISAGTDWGFTGKITWEVGGDGS